MDAGSSSSEDTGSSSSEEKQRICAILNMDSDYYAVYIIDIVSEDGAADDDAIVDLNRVDTYRFARQFVERDPNFFIQDFTETDGLCALGSTIFMFEGVDYRRIKVDTLYRSMGIYSFPLPAEHMVRTAGTEPIPCYHKSKLRKSSDMLGLKCSAEAVAVPVEHGTSSSTRIIIFSTQIEYFYDRSIDFDDRVVDFEIYNTESKLSLKLPPLRIGRQSATIFTLVDLVRDQSYCFTPKYNIECYWKGGEWRSSFRIRAYTFLNDDTFVVEPDFGGVRFSLDLASDSENQKWEIFGVPLSLPCNYQHFITEELVVVSSYGSHELGFEYESSAVIRFPLCSFVSPQLERKTSSIILLDNTRSLGCVACIVQVGEDDSERPFWTMDVVGFNVMPSWNNDEPFARRIKSFKFTFSCNSVSSCIAGLFAF